MTEQQLPSFEISIDKDAGKTVDISNISPKVFHSFNSIATSVETLIEGLGENVSVDLGTNKVAIKATQQTLAKLEKSIEDYRENRLSRKSNIYKGLLGLEQIITANGNTYTAIIKSSPTQQRVITPYFKKEVISSEVEDMSSVIEEERMGLKFYKGTVKGIDVTKDPFIKFVIDPQNSYYLDCTPQQIYSLTHLFNQEVHLLCKFYKGARNKTFKILLNLFSEKEFSEFYSFYQQIYSLEGTEKLKVIYKFLNQFVDKDELNLLIKYSRVFLDDDKADISMLRIIIEVLKKVNDENIIHDTYNDYIMLVNKKIGTNIR